MIGNENLVSILNPGLANRAYRELNKISYYGVNSQKHLQSYREDSIKLFKIERIERLPFINTNAVLKSEILNTEQNKSVSIFETSAGHGHRGERLSSCSVSRRVAARRDVSSQLNLT